MAEGQRIAIAAEAIKSLTDEDQRIRAKLGMLRRDFRRKRYTRIGIRFALVAVTAASIAYWLGAGLGLAIFLGLLVLWVWWNEEVGSFGKSRFREIDGVVISIAPSPSAIHAELKFCGREAWDALSEFATSAGRDTEKRWMALFDRHSFTVLSNGLVFMQGGPVARPARGSRLFPDDFNQTRAASIETIEVSDWLTYENPSFQRENGHEVHRGAGWWNDLELVIPVSHEKIISLFRVPAELFRRAESVGHYQHQIALLAACGWESGSAEGSKGWRHRFGSLVIQAWEP